MNFRFLLKKYMTLVMHEEGVSFIEHLSPRVGGSDPLDFKAEELKALSDIESEIGRKDRTCLSCMVGFTMEDLDEGKGLTPCCGTENHAAVFYDNEV